MIDIVDYKTAYSGRINLCLGYFDSLHKGHVDLIKASIESGVECTVFTFANNANRVLGGTQLQVFTMQERVMRMEELGVNVVIKAIFDSNLMYMSGEDFLNGLLTSYNINKVIIGSDYRCGAGAKWTADMVHDYLAHRGIAVEVIGLRIDGGDKISSGRIRQLIACGDIKTVNKLLPLPYFIHGKVKSGRGEGGKKLGFPTANIEFIDDKLPLKEGVYKTIVLISGVRYAALTNVGGHPTFDDFHYNVESFILDYSGNIYDEYITVYFIDRIRDTIKFASYAELTQQITRDVEYCRVCNDNS